MGDYHDDICPICGKQIEEVGDRYTELGSIMCKLCQNALELIEEND